MLLQRDIRSPLQTNRKNSFCKNDALDNLLFILFFGVMRFFAFKKMAILHEVLSEWNIVHIEWRV